MILEIQIIKRNIINFISIIRPLEIVISDLQNKHILLSTPEVIEKLDDTLDKVKKILENLYNLKEQMVMLTETNEAVTARSTNQVIKTLTSISMIILVPNIITSFFGMNVYFGWGLENNHLPLIFISIAIILLTFSLFVILQRRKWL